MLDKEQADELRWCAANANEDGLVDLQPRFSGFGEAEDSALRSLYGDLQSLGYLSGVTYADDEPQCAFLTSKGRSAL